MNIYLEIIGWIGNIFFVLGAYYLAHRKKIGFHYNIYGNIMYIIQAMFCLNSSLLCLGLILVWLNIIGIKKFK